MSMAGPLGVLAACLAPGTTEVEMSMAGPLGVLAACPPAATTKAEDIDGGAPWGCWR
jgi:hypothetical protein